MALDGSVHSNVVSATHNLSLTTSNADCVIVAVVACNLAGGVTGISSSNTTGWTQRAVGGSGSSRIELWYGVAASALSSETITVTIGASAYTTIDIFGISGADTTQIYDTNAALPDVGTTTTRSITTDTADTFCIGGYRFGSTASPTEGTGWTKISGAHYALTEYKIVSSTQSGLSVAIGTGAGNQNGGVADAIVMASAGGTAHSTSGSVTGGGSSVDGAAARTRVHASTGDLSGGGAALEGSAQHYALHITAGALSGDGAAVSGAVLRITEHSTSGSLIGSGSVIDGAAARTRVHPATGDLVGGGAVVDGSAVRSEIPEHFTSGAILGGGASVSGSAARFRAFTTSGALVGGGANVEGAAERSGPAEHATSGDIAGDGAAVDGQAERHRAFETTGAIEGGGAAIAGVAAIVRTHATSGDLFGDGALVTGVVIRGGQVELLHVTVTARAAFACAISARAANNCTVSEAIAA